MKVDSIEENTLRVAVMASLSMAAAGWVTYYFTASEAMLLDGNFSFINAIATIIAIYISRQKHKKTTTFPFGSYAYEAAFVLSKGLLILGIISAAFLQNIFRIIDYFQGEKMEAIILTPIYFYSMFILLITCAMLWFYKRQNHKISNKSSLLKVESNSAKVDGTITLCTGLVFLLLSFIPVGSGLDFLLSIGDALIVVCLSLLMIKKPISIIKNSFIELGAGTIQNKSEKTLIEASINEVVQGTIPFNTYITKVGSGYFVVIYVQPLSNSLNLENFRNIQRRVKAKLSGAFPTIFVEISFIN